MRNYHRDDPTECAVEAPVCCWSVQPSVFGDLDGRRQLLPGDPVPGHNFDAVAEDHVSDLEQLASNNNVCKSFGNADPRHVRKIIEGFPADLHNTVCIRPNRHLAMRLPIWHTVANVAHRRGES